MTSENIKTPDGGTLELFSTGAELASAGSGVVVVPASMVTAADYTKFAQKLSAALGRPVHTFNRRGRGSSSPQAEDYTLDADIRDLDAVMKHTSSTDVFGHSFGGAVALHAARTLPVERLAVYDPAVSVNHSVKADWTAEYERATAAGDDDRALAVLTKGLETGAFSRMPLSMLTIANKLTAGTHVGKQMRELMRTGVREIKAIIAADMPAEPFLELPLETLIVVGEKSPAYFGVACGQIHDVLSGSSYTILHGAGHDGVLRAPDKLITELSDFFAG
ncbi:alpha/beta fold hydrolase [Pseudarthrobacter cellobiosi]|uniref:alpha/beta fold hydrolase n=1 Tax=Pseudarthrobacter cellobiosi TaxID=2953654 RepID=UPI00208E8329|nr:MULTISPECIES: alpha/beta hydrolase [unclassified Pseudarthrobacter]MCO4255248.1 alpha/beta hydrolase [Pseudarthrobacter sp. HLT1-5]MCO4275318.1 alpha/beta hydrolase [Pseudarthrobacter sp. HLT3-5]